MKTYLWDPSEPVATRILHMNILSGGQETDILHYTHDLQKNVTALFGQQAGRRAQYEYDPYGNPINTTGDAAGLNPFRYSSEYHDEDLGLIYYNYRHYNPTDGRWINRDPIAEQGGRNLYGFVGNRAGWTYDWLGLHSECKETLQNEYQCGPDTTDWFIDIIQKNIELLKQRKKKFEDYTPSIWDSDPTSTHLSRGVYAETEPRWFFYEMVSSQAPWDYKRGIFTSKNCPSAKCKKTITLCGRCYPQDIIGNMNFAIVGRILFSEDILKRGANAAAAKGYTNKAKALLLAYEFDSPDDLRAIGAGFSFYRSQTFTKDSFCKIMNNIPHYELVDAEQKENIQKCKPCSEACQWEPHAIG